MRAQELGRANPALVQLIQAHQEDFLRLLQEDPGDEELDELGALEGLEAGEGEEEEDEGMEGGEGGVVAVELSEEDMSKVERLQALGFARDACIEALLACDKDEELAANFLAEQMFD